MIPINEAIHDYIGRGWSIIPIRGGDKRPLIRWEPFQQTRADETTALGWFRTWPDVGIGVVTGTVSGLVVLDVDVRHAGDVALEQLEREHGRLPTTVEMPAPRRWTPGHLLRHGIVTSGHICCLPRTRCLCRRRAGALTQEVRLMRGSRRPSTVARAGSLHRLRCQRASTPPGNARPRPRSRALPPTAARASSAPPPRAADRARPGGPPVRVVAGTRHHLPSWSAPLHARISRPSKRDRAGTHLEH
jgi:hypothetical protein